MIFLVGTDWFYRRIATDTRYEVVRAHQCSSTADFFAWLRSISLLGWAEPEIVLQLFERSIYRPP